MIKPPVIISSTTANNQQVIATFMDEMASQMDLSADTMRMSPLAARAGAALAKAASGMADRASQIRVITNDFRINGDLASFDQACKIAGWRPQPGALEALMAGSSAQTIQ